MYPNGEACFIDSEALSRDMAHGARDGVIGGETPIKKQTPTEVDLFWSKRIGLWNGKGRWQAEGKRGKGLGTSQERAEAKQDRNA